jgi:hypothetical protein
MNNTHATNGFVIPTPTQTETIRKVLNSATCVKWSGVTYTELELQCRIFDGGKEWCNELVEFLQEIRPYGYKKAITALQNIR